ncbi:hypothetical protein AB0I68_09230 [Streptomyces sp. NPDC050448]|uniref:hypothetical protein n=1 Tax=Streptomyces sp. NPDC050448 TaxID=3155404 RepID=UPI00341A1FB9
MSSNVLPVIASGTIGAAAALLSQYLSSRAAQARHKMDFALKKRELWNSFILPAATLRSGAYEKIYDHLQAAAEARKLSIEDYKLIRRQLIYLPKDTKNSLVSTLTRLLRAVREADEEAVIHCIAEVELIQGELRRLLGLEAIEKYVDHLSDEPTT